MSGPPWSSKIARPSPRSRKTRSMSCVARRRSGRRARGPHRMRSLRPTAPGARAASSGSNERADATPRANTAGDADARPTPHRAGSRARASAERACHQSAPHARMARRDDRGTGWASCSASTCCAGSSLGIVQTNHGAKFGVASACSPGDGLVYYSPKTSTPTGDPLREFTAIGRDRRRRGLAGRRGRASDPWRRKVEYDESAPAAPITPLLDVLELTRGNRNWGLIMQTRAARADASTTSGSSRSEMGAGSLPPRYVTA